MNGVLFVADVSLQTIVAYVHLLCMNAMFAVTNTCCVQCLLCMNVCGV